MELERLVTFITKDVSFVVFTLLNQSCFLTYLPCRFFAFHVAYAGRAKVWSTGEQDEMTVYCPLFGSSLGSELHANNLLVECIAI